MRPGLCVLPGCAGSAHLALINPFPPTAEAAEGLAALVPPPTEDRRAMRRLPGSTGEAGLQPREGGGSIRWVCHLHGRGMRRGTRRSLQLPSQPPAPACGPPAPPPQPATCTQRATSTWPSCGRTAAWSAPWSSRTELKPSTSSACEPLLGLGRAVLRVGRGVVWCGTAGEGATRCDAAWSRRVLVALAALLPAIPPAPPPPPPRLAAAACCGRRASRACLSTAQRWRPGWPASGARRRRPTRCA